MDGEDRTKDITQLNVVDPIGLGIFLPVVGHAVLVGPLGEMHPTYQRSCRPNGAGSVRLVQKCARMVRLFLVVPCGHAGVVPMLVRFDMLQLALQFSIVDFDARFQTMVIDMPRLFGSAIDQLMAAIGAPLVAEGWEVVEALVPLGQSFDGFIYYPVEDASSVRTASEVFFSDGPQFLPYDHRRDAIHLLGQSSIQQQIPLSQDVLFHPSAGFVQFQTSPKFVTTFSIFHFFAAITT